MTTSLVVFYSKTDSTKTIAEHIKSLTNADLLQIEATEPYPKDYHRTCDIAKKEIDAGKVRDYKTEIPDLSKYTTVYVGSPCWWSHIAPPLKKFLQDHNLAGKTVVPFNTNLGSGMGDVESDIRSLCSQSDVKKGMAFWGSSVKGDKGKVENWLREIGCL